MDNIARILSEFALNSYSNISSDEELQNDDRLRMSERNQKYSEVLTVYIDNTKKILMVKLAFRIIFLLVSIGALVGHFVYFVWFYGG